MHPTTDIMEQTGQALIASRPVSDRRSASLTDDPLAEYDALMRLWVTEALVPRSEKLNRENARQLASFEKDWTEIRGNYSASRQVDVDKYTRLLLQLLSRVNSPKFVSVKMTQEESVFFQISYSGGLNGYVELHFGEPDPIEIVFNLYRDKRPVKAYGGTVEHGLGVYLLALNA